MTETGPYGTAADLYWQAGWRGIVPLPPRAKKHPPRGFTGEAGIYPSYPDIHAWAEGPERLGNIALRMPANVIGIDVDAYGDKPGAQTLALAEAAHGPLPATWRTTSRDDGTSGIRLYRVPEGLAWPGEIGGATEVIQSRHRYAVVWPSVHPEGRTYRWISPAGVVSTTIPDPDALPELPEEWVAAYTGGELATSTARVQVAHSDAIAWIAGRDHATDSMCTRMETALATFTDDLRGSAHNSTRNGVLRIARLADEGHHGAVHALAQVRRLFLADATSPTRAVLGKHRRTDAEAVYEFGEMVASAVGLVIANPTGMPACDCYGQITGLIVATATSGTAALAPLVAPEQRTAVDETEDDPGAARFKDGAAFILDAPDTLPTIWGDGDECLWAKGEATMICGPPGVGKTTLTGQVLRGLIGLQKRVLGLPVQPMEGRVLYLAMDRPAQIARGLRRSFHESERSVLADRLRFWEGPPPGDVARHPTVLLSLAELAEAEVIIIDSVKDAAIGLTEDEVAAAYNRARQHCLANGVEVLELHHMVKRGANGSKPTELADVYGSAWLTAGAGSVVLLWGAAGDPIVTMTHLKQPASEVGPWTLEHDHDRGQTTVFHGADLLSVMAVAGSVGITVNDAAKVLYSAEKVTEAERRKAARKLGRLVESGLAERFEAPRDGWSGGKPQACYRAVTTNGHPMDTPISGGDGDPNGHQWTETAFPQVSPMDNPMDTNGHDPHAIPMDTAPPFKGGAGGRSRPLTSEEQPTGGPETACRRCFRPTPELGAKLLDGMCRSCAQEAGLL